MDPFHVLFGEKDILKGGFVAIYVVWPSPPVLLRGLSGGALTVSQFLDGGCWEGEVELFKGVAVFT